MQSYFMTLPRQTSSVVVSILMSHAELSRETIRSHPSQIESCYVVPFVMYALPNCCLQSTFGSFGCFLHGKGEFWSVKMGNRKKYFYDTILLEASQEGRSGFDTVIRRKPPRLVKTYLPYNLIEKSVRNRNTKIIVFMRNPKDTLLSFYHFYRMNSVLEKFKGTWEEFYGLFQKNRLIYGNWFDFTEGYWSSRSRSNVFIVKYEEMVENLSGVVQKLAQFLAKDLDRKHWRKYQNMGLLKK